MTQPKLKSWAPILMRALLLGGILFSAVPATAQEEVTSAISRYKQYEVSTGYYEQYEARPRHQRPLVGIPGVSRGIFPYSPTAALNSTGVGAVKTVTSQKPATFTRPAPTSPVASATAGNPLPVSIIITHR